MPTTTITTKNGKTTSYTGTSGITLTGNRVEDTIEVNMILDVATKEEAISLVASLLCQLEEMHGEGFVTACIAQYAMETKKEFVSSPTSDYQVGLLRGEKSIAKKYRS